MIQFTHPCVVSDNTNNLTSSHGLCTHPSGRGQQGQPPRRSIHCGAALQSQCIVLFSFVSSGYQWGCTLAAERERVVAAVSAQPLVEHVKKTLQNITTEWSPQSVALSPSKTKKEDKGHPSCSTAISIPPLSNNVVRGLFSIQYQRAV